MKTAVVLTVAALFAGCATTTITVVPKYESQRRSDSATIAVEAAKSDPLAWDQPADVTILLIDGQKADSPSSLAARAKEAWIAMDRTKVDFPSDEALKREDLYLAPGKHKLSVDCRLIETVCREGDRYGNMIMISASEALEVELLSNHVYRWLCLLHKERSKKGFLIVPHETDTFTLTLWDVTGGIDSASVIGTWNLKGVSDPSLRVPNTAVSG